MLDLDSRGFSTSVHIHLDLVTVFCLVKPLQVRFFFSVVSAIARARVVVDAYTRVCRGSTLCGS